jgi:hypothetical protein
VVSCGKEEDKIIGTWQNNLGQTLIFKNDKTALWLFKSENKVDTFKIKYTTDFKAEPIILDLTDFQVGPLSGKTLFGIIKFGENNFLCDFEAGTDKSVRPNDFDAEQSQKYVRIKN